MSNRIFELRTYYTAPGKLAALETRFRDHTLALFRKHGLEVVGFFTPTDGDGVGNTLVYLMAFESRAAADAAWESFRADPDWIAAKAASEADGPVVDRVESVFLDPTEYSALR
ncbi:NIPSNAP family protein [Planctomonas psychrotolerans]|uniref:NIPSNAP family protein n=1 Tax=Planctomonas psychrotolerans TaxID=2528712 RepID=UPI00123A6416|nr:NIPSNAP family protein [Planctomonas psychrotolerans]